MKRAIPLILLFMLLLLSASCVKPNAIPKETTAAKPVIYLYPKEASRIHVKLEYDGELTCSYPEYDQGWSVWAEPTGALKDVKTGEPYSYLFWEGKTDKKWDIKEGFVVTGEATAGFLKDKLSYLGLLPHEYNEFIVYWLPQMQENRYNLIYFAGEEYESLAKLSIDPQPDSILRVFMVYKPLDQPVTIKEQELKTFERTGFSVIEWGGTKIE